MPRAAFDLRRTGRVTEDERVRRAAVDEPERDAGVQRMDERPLTFDEQQLAAAASTLDDEPLVCAGQEVGDDGVYRDPPARDRDAGLAGRHEHGVEAAIARLEIELHGDRLLPDRAVRADREDDRRVDVEVRAGRDTEPRGRLAEVAQLDPARSSEVRQLGILRDELVEAALDVETCRDRVLQELAPGG